MRGNDAKVSKYEDTLGMDVALKDKYMKPDIFLNSSAPTEISSILKLQELEHFNKIPYCFMALVTV